MSGAISLLPLVALFALLHGGAAFSTSPNFAKGARNSCSLHSLCRQGQFSSATTSLAAKKRRKRRKEDSSPEPLSDELPDFDMDDEPATGMESSTTSSDNGGADGLSLAGLMDDNDPNLKELMKGTATSGAESAKDLLRGRDRTLEQAFEFDKVSAPLPSLKGKTAVTEPGMGGKKRARAEARKEAAIQAAEEEASPSVEDLIASLPFVGKRPGEKMTAIKLLETGAWTGITLLILWEVYLNSPLFDRAAPLSPAVF